MKGVFYLEENGKYIQVSSSDFSEKIRCLKQNKDSYVDTDLISTFHGLNVYYFEVFDFEVHTIGKIEFIEE